MVTKSEKDKVVGIQVNWDEFDVDKKAVNDIDLTELENPIINIPQKKMKFLKQVLK